MRSFNLQLIYIAIVMVAGIACVFGQSHEGANGARPNILICMADDASFPYMGAYGATWLKTPGFDSVARAGLLFMNAYTPNAKCAPSRACILTGRNSWQLEAAANHWAFFPEKFKTFIEAPDRQRLPYRLYAKGLVAWKNCR